MNERKDPDGEGYGDLLDAYGAGEDKGPAQPGDAAKRSAARAPFKVNIQELDREFYRDDKRAAGRAGRGAPFSGGRSAAEKKALQSERNRAEAAKRRAAAAGESSPAKAPHHREVGMAPEPQADGRGDVQTPPENRMKKKKRPNFFVRNRKAWSIVGLCVLCSLILSSYLISCMNDVLAIRRDDSNTVTVTIPAETNTKDILKILKKSDLIEHRLFCTLYAKLMRFRDDNYLSGIYYITASMGVEKMLETFKSPPTTGKTVTLTFPEGFTADQIAKKLAANGVCSADDFYRTLRVVDFSREYDFIRELSDREQRYHVLEGYLYPDTYDFYVGENPSSIVRKFLNNFKKKWTGERRDRAAALNMSVDEVVTLASILEKEAANAGQMAQVSSVIHNRLARPGLYPSLQCDSTTSYIDSYIKRHVVDPNEVNAYIARYSTYKCEGLPVGAICNPGGDAISAALEPAKTDYYFFAHDNNRKIYLARNDAERIQNSIAILRANKEAEREKKNGDV